MTNIFNIPSLLNNTSPVNAMNTSALNESYFLTTLNYIQEMKNEYRVYSKELFKSILESEGSDDFYVINESFNDFTDKIREMIKKFLKFIKSIVDRFLYGLHKMINSDKYIDRNKDLLRKFSNNHEFEMDIFEYTLERGVPVTSAVYEFNEDFVGLNFDFNDAKNDKDILTYISNAKGALSKELDNGWYDEFRGKVLNKGDNYKITSDDFIEELTKVFRNDNDIKSTTTITFAHVMESLAHFSNYKSHKQSVEKDKVNIDKEYKQIEKSLNTLISKSSLNDIRGAVSLAIDSSYNGSNKDIIQVSDDIFTKLNLFIKAKINQVMEMSNIHAMAFSYKLDAINDCYKQDKEIIYKALSQIHKDKELRYEGVNK
ncbi:MAG: hypothetical protein ACRCXT_11020 [Paraclostridium sp.]